MGSDYFEIDRMLAIVFVAVVAWIAPGVMSVVDAVVLV